MSGPKERKDTKNKAWLEYFPGLKSWRNMTVPVFRVHGQLFLKRWLTSFWQTRSSNHDIGESLVYNAIVNYVCICSILTSQTILGSNIFYFSRTGNN